MQGEVGGWEGGGEGSRESGGRGSRIRRWNPVSSRAAIKQMGYQEEVGKRPTDLVSRLEGRAYLDTGVYLYECLEGVGILFRIMNF